MSAYYTMNPADLPALLTAWHGQGPVDLPGGVRVTRRDGMLVLTRTV